MTLEYLNRSKVQKAGKPDDCDDKPKPQCSQPQCEENSEKVFIVYKFIQTPIDAIIAGM